MQRPHLLAQHRVVERRVEEAHDCASLLWELAQQADHCGRRRVARDDDIVPRRLLIGAGRARAVFFADDAH